MTTQHFPTHSMERFLSSWSWPSNISATRCTGVCFNVFFVTEGSTERNIVLKGWRLQILTCKQWCLHLTVGQLYSIVRIYYLYEIPEGHFILHLILSYSLTLSLTLIITIFIIINFPNHYHLTLIILIKNVFIVSNSTILL